MTIQKNKNKVIAGAATLLAMAPEAAASDGCATFSDKKVMYYPNCQALLDSRDTTGAEEVFPNGEYNGNPFNWATQIDDERVVFHSDQEIFLWKVAAGAHEVQSFRLDWGACSAVGGDYDAENDRYVVACYANGIIEIENFSGYFTSGDQAQFDNDMTLHTGDCATDDQSICPRMHNAYFFNFPGYDETDMVGSQIFAGWSSLEPGDSSGYGITVWDEDGGKFVDTGGAELDFEKPDLEDGLEFKGARSLAQSKADPRIIFAIGESTQPSGKGVSYLRAFQRANGGRYVQLNANDNEGKGYALGVIGEYPHTDLEAPGNACPTWGYEPADCVGGGADVFIYPSKEDRDEVICTSDRYVGTKQIRCFTFDALTATFSPAGGTDVVLTNKATGRHTTAFATGADEYVVTSHQSGAVTACKNLLDDTGLTCDAVIEDPTEQFFFFLPLTDSEGSGSPPGDETPPEEPPAFDPCDEGSLMVEESLVLV